MRGLKQDLAAAGVVLRSARPEDAQQVWALVGRAGELEQNTEYAYVLLCDHFRTTSVVAERDGIIVGAVLGYRPPSRPEALFVWQVGVDPAARGLGLGRALLQAFVASEGGAGARNLEATVAPNNVPSRALFAAFARAHGASMEEYEGYPASLFSAQHEPERLLRIGPLSPISTSPISTSPISTSPISTSPMSTSPISSQHAPPSLRVQRSER